MKPYAYETAAYRNDREIIRAVKKLDGTDLAFFGVKPNREGFLELLNRWNRNGQLGIANGSPIYIYTALAE